METKTQKFQKTPLIVYYDTSDLLDHEVAFNFEYIDVGKPESHRFRIDPALKVFNIQTLELKDRRLCMMFTGVKSLDGSNSELILVSKIIGDETQKVGESPVREL